MDPMTPTLVHGNLLGPPLMVPLQALVVLVLAVAPTLLMMAAMDTI
jgi:hypothetical protein